MSTFLSYIVSGAITGCVYSMLALGLVLTYQTTRTLNLAQGAFAFVGALMFFELNTAFGWPPVLAGIAVVGVILPALGLVMEAAVMRHLSEASDGQRLLATVGLLVAIPAAFLFAIEQLMKAGVGVLGTQFALIVPGLGPSPKTQWQVTDSLVVDSDQLVVVAAAAISAAFLWWFVTRTRRGLGMRAAVDRPSLGRMRGIDVRLTARTAWVLAAGLSGLAGVAAAPNPAFGLNPDNYTLALVVAASAAALARFKSLPVAFAGGMLLGVAQNLVSGYLGPHINIVGFATSTPFWLLFIALIVLGRNKGERATGVAATEAPPRSAASDLPAWRRGLPFAIATALLVVYTLFVADAIWQTIIVQALAVGILFLSFTVIAGMGGMISLAQATFGLAGGLFAGMLISHGVPLAFAAVGGIAFATALGVVSALPAIRLGGVTLSLATLAFAYICDRVLFQMKWLGNGQTGWEVPRPEIAGLDFTDDKLMAMLLLTIIFVVILGIKNLQRSPSGRAIYAVRTTEPAAAASAVSSVRTKLALFGVSAAIAGLGGVMFMSATGSVTSTTWTPLVGLLWLTVVAIFGLSRPAGAVIAGIMIFAFPRILQDGFLFFEGTESSLIPSILFGLGAVGLAQQPEGMLADWGNKFRERREKKAEKAAARAAAASGTAPAIVSPVAEAQAPLAQAATTAAPATNGHGPVDGYALDIQGLRAGYDEVQVLHGIDVRVPKGSIVAVIGANGAGKSTLCSVIAGLVAPTEGRVVLHGDDITDVPAHRRPEGGLLVAPESRGIFPSLPVDDNVALWLTDGADKDAMYERFEHLARRKSSRAGNLSGGEQQILTLAPILQRPPKVLIADEPTLGLAPQITKELMGYFVELKEQGTTLLLSEEKARDVLPIADHVIVLELGRVAWSGPRSELDVEVVARAYVGA